MEMSIQQLKTEIDQLNKFQDNNLSSLLEKEKPLEIFICSNTDSSTDVTKCNLSQITKRFGIIF